MDVWPDNLTSPIIRDILEAATAEGNAIEHAAEWEKAYVIYMRKPLSSALKGYVTGKYSTLRYYEASGSPHTPPGLRFY